ncbi:MAG: hypothetical protein AB9834_16325 [Lentimicrobium sp.]
MDIFERSLLLLDEYFSTTNPAVVEEKLHIIDNLQIAGPAIDEYLSDFSQGFQYNNWFQTDEKRTHFVFNNFSNITRLSLSLILDSEQVPEQHFVSNLGEEFIVDDDRKQAA